MIMEINYIIHGPYMETLSAGKSYKEEPNL